MKKIRFSNIVWDTDGENPHSLKLPICVEMEIDDPDFDPEMEGADKLSDKYGYCVESFNFNWLTA